MSAKTNFQSNGSSIIRPLDDELTGYYREFNGLWTHENEFIASAVTIDHLVLHNGDVCCQINGTSVEAIMQGELP